MMLLCSDGDLFDSPDGSAFRFVEEGGLTELTHGDLERIQ